MKNILWSLLALPLFTVAQNSASYTAARTSMMKGEFEQALLQLDKVKKEEPSNVQAWKDELYIHYLQRNFKAAKATGERLVEMPNADVSSYELLGLTYKALAEYKDAEKLYKKALNKFGDNAVIYKEYGDLQALRNEKKEAIALWEKGISTDPNISGNYFHAAKYHYDRKEFLHAALLAEIFANIESYSNSTREMKQLAADSYKQFFLVNTTTGSPFYEAVAKQLKSSNAYAAINPEVLTKVRAAFIDEWYKQKLNEKYPFRLFEHHKQLMKENTFAAYNQWLFDVEGTEYQKWKEKNLKEAESFEQAQRGRMFKTPKGQFYK